MPMLPPILTAHTHDEGNNLRDNKRQFVSKDVEKITAILIDSPKYFCISAVEAR